MVKRRGLKFKKYRRLRTPQKNAATKECRAQWSAKLAVPNSYHAFLNYSPLDYRFWNVVKDKVYEIQGQFDNLYATWRWQLDRFDPRLSIMWKKFVRLWRSSPHACWMWCMNWMVNASKCILVNLLLDIIIPHSCIQHKHNFFVNLTLNSWTSQK